MSDEDVWAVVMSVPVIRDEGVTPHQFSTIRQGLEESPEAVHRLVASAEKASNPAPYFGAALRRVSTEGWGGRRTPPEGAIRSDHQKQLARLTTLARNMRSSTDFEDEEAWERYVRSEAADLTLASLSDGEILSVIERARQARPLAGT